MNRIHRKWIFVLTLAAGFPLLAVSSQAGAWSFGFSLSSGPSYYSYRSCAPVYYRPAYRHAFRYRHVNYHPLYYGARHYVYAPRVYYRAPVRRVVVTRAYVPRYDYRTRESLSISYSSGRHSGVSFGYSRYGNRGGVSFPTSTHRGHWTPGYVDTHGRYVPGCYR